MPFDASDFEGLGSGEFLEALASALTSLEGGGAGAMELVDTIIISGVAVDTVTFAGLDGGAVGEYVISGEWVLAGSLTSLRLAVLPNGITTGQRTTWDHTTFSTSVGATLARLVACVHEGGIRDCAKFRARLTPTIGRPRELLFAAGSGASSGITPSASQFTAYNGYGLWNNVVTPITSLVLQPVNSSGVAQVGTIDEGTSVSLYKMQR